MDKPHKNLEFWKKSVELSILSSKKSGYFPIFRQTL